jgi:hypothetical protein
MLFAYGTSNAGKTYTNQRTSQEPGIIIPCPINILFNTICEKQNETCTTKPDIVICVVKFDDKLVQQRTAHLQQIMTMSQKKCHLHDTSCS